jgi:nickel-responsive transcriptional regulator NikR
VRDILRSHLQVSEQKRNQKGSCVAALSYVYNHHKRELAERLTSIQHEHHELTVSTMHAHLDHEECIETVILKGSINQVRQFSDAAKVLSEKAAAESISNLDGSFKSVSNAAKEADFGKHFSVSMKMLSQYAHPTAMLLLAPPNSATPMHAEMFYGLGSLYFTGAFTALEKLLLQCHQGN